MTGTRQNFGWVITHIRNAVWAEPEGTPNRVIKCEMRISGHPSLVADEWYPINLSDSVKEPTHTATAYQKLVAKQAPFADVNIAAYVPPPPPLPEPDEGGHVHIATTATLTTSPNTGDEKKALTEAWNIDAGWVGNPEHGIKQLEGSPQILVLPVVRTGAMRRYRMLLLESVVGKAVKDELLLRWGHTELPTSDKHRLMFGPVSYLIPSYTHDFAGGKTHVNLFLPVGVSLFADSKVRASLA